MALMRCPPALYACCLALAVATASSFELPNIFKSPLAPPSPTGPSVSSLKAEIISKISGTNNGKDASPELQQEVLSLVRQLEKKSPAPSTILTDPKEAQALNGKWYLQYTSPSDVTIDEDAWVPENASEGGSIETRKANNKGSISATGIRVDTSNRVTTQTIDTINSRVENFVEQDYGAVSVEGDFRVSETVPNRAVVAFDKAKVEFNSGFTLNLSLVFSLLAVFRGTKDAGWLETSFCDSDMRIGRGNKATMFVLTRERDAVSP